LPPSLHHATALATVKTASYDPTALNRVLHPNALQGEEKMIEYRTERIERELGDPRKMLVAVFEGEGGGNKGRGRVVGYVKWTFPALVSVDGMGMETETENEVTGERAKEDKEPEDAVKVRPSPPKGTNMRLWEAFRGALDKGREKYYDESRDWGEFFPFSRVA